MHTQPNKRVVMTMALLMMLGFVGAGATIGVSQPAATPLAQVSSPAGVAQVPAS